MTVSCSTASKILIRNMQWVSSSSFYEKYIFTANMWCLNIARTNESEKKINGTRSNKLIYINKRCTVYTNVENGEKHRCIHIWSNEHMLPCAASHFFRYKQWHPLLLLLLTTQYKWCDVQTFFGTVVNWITWHWLKFWVQFHFCYSISIHVYYIQYTIHNLPSAFVYVCVCALNIQWGVHLRCPWIKFH